MKPVLVILCAGQREYREPMLTRIAEEYDLALVSPTEVTWEKPYIIDHVVVDPADTQGYVDAALRFAEQYRVVGVFTYYEWCVEIAARIGELLGLPQCTPASATRCRDKWESREAFRGHGVASAKSVLVADVDEAKRAASRIGYPVVVKPRAQSASLGVTLASDERELVAAFDRAYSSPSNGNWEHQHGVLIEEYLDGDEISVDSVVSGGRLEAAIYAKKVLGYPPFFEELGHIVAEPNSVAPDPLAVWNVVRAAHEALGVDNAVTHTELRLTSRGPKVVEVNGRSGGDFISELGLLAGGVDLARATAFTAAGRVSNLSFDRNLVAGVRFLHSDASGVVESCEIDPDAAFAPGVNRVVWLVRPGSEIRATPGRRYFARAGFVVVTADSISECRARMESVAARARINVKPFSTDDEVH
jgi:biotin carboxylase